MTPRPKDTAPDAAKVARELTEALNGMSSRLDAARRDSEERDAELAAYGQRNRRLIHWTIISVVLDIALSVILGVVAVQAHHASDTATTASARVAHVSASNSALCRAGNTARHQQIELWTFLLGLGHQPQTAEQRKTIAEFEAHLHKIFAPRNCAALGKKPTGRPTVSPSPAASPAMATRVPPRHHR